MPLSGWRRAVADQVSATSKDAQSHGSGSPRTKIRDARVGFPIELHELLIQAAQRRNISIAGYVRRAVLSWVARDLGIDIRTLIAKDRAPARYGEVNAADGKDVEFEVFGSWEI